MPPKATRTTRRGNGSDRVTKRSGNACVRCRSQKVKCSGSQPCEACKKRRLPCIFDERDQKILVTKGYILDLEQRAAKSGTEDVTNYITPETLNATQDSTGGSPHNETTPIAPTDSRNLIQVPSVPARNVTSPLAPVAQPGEDHTTPRIASPQQTRNQQPVIDDVASTITNPLSTGPSIYMKSSDGSVHYLGTSSNWSFTRRVISLSHEYIRRRPMPLDTLVFDSSAYDLGWDGFRVTGGPKTPTLPSLDYATHLVNAVKFHCTQIYHLFDEQRFMDMMYDFYADPTTRMATADLNYLHILVVLALGKALVNEAVATKRPPGADLFVKAMQMLPNIHALTKEPLLSTEVLCCMSLYLQSLDYRASAYTLIGQAMRVAMTHGMHTDMPVHHLGEHYVERSRKIWWTIYIMDREMASLMGVPPSIHDDDIETKMPIFLKSAQRSLALTMQIQLSQTIAKINRGVYRPDGRLDKRFLMSSKEVLSNIASFADELRQKFPIYTDKSFVTGISMISGYLHLLYHQCIVLATRPLLLCFLKIRLESPESYVNTLNSSNTVWNLIKMCMESSQQIINILTELQNQGLLETFLPFNLEPLSVAMVNFTIGKALNPRFVESPSAWLDKSKDILNEIARRGNLIAEYRKTEAQLLESILNDINSVLPLHPQNTLDSAQAVPSILPRQEYLSLQNEQSDSLQDAAHSWASSGMDFLDFPNLDLEFTTAQITEMADSIANSDADWMQYTLTEHSI